MLRTSTGTTPRPTVAIVGSGFSGTMVAVHLASREPRAARVLLFERDSRMGRGTAYGTVIAEHLLNVPARLMSAFPDQPDHFLSWIRARDPETDAGAFVPRRVYGDYLEELLRKAVDRPGSPLAPIRAEVVDMEEEIDGGFTLLSGTGERFRADVVVLALGNPGPRDPIEVPWALRTRGAYLGNPRPGEALGGLDRADSIVLIGSGLTAVDLVVEAESRRTVGMITAISRHGLLPQCHAHAATLESPIPGPHPAGRLSSRKLFQQVRDAVREVEGEGGNWRSVIDALRPGIQELWSAFDAREKERFLRHLAAFWDSHRHRLAPEVDEILRRARGEGRLRVIAGRIRELRDPPGDGVQVVLSRRECATTEALHASRVINCTGPSRDLRTGFPHLLTSLCDRGLARPDPLGMGLEVDANGALKGPTRKGGGRIFAIGPVLKGQYWETTAVRELRQQAADLARHVTAIMHPAPQRSAPEAHWHLTARRTRAS